MFTKPFSTFKGQLLQEEKNGFNWNVKELLVTPDYLYHFSPFFSELLF